MASRDALLRLNDFYEVYTPADPEKAQEQGERCMNCGAAFCMPNSGYGQGCPIYNKIPEWNELVQLGRWEDAYRRLAQTNPFPEFTSRVCPAPCQDACILGINDAPVQIKGIERAIIDRAFDEGWVQPDTPEQRGGMRISIVGSGPAGLSAAYELNRLGYQVTVYERSDLPGGLLRYGVPNMKLDKSVLDRRIKLMSQSGVQFRVNTEIGREISMDQLAATSDAVVLACGAMSAREIDLPGRSLEGIHQALAYLTSSMKAFQEEALPAIDAKGKHVVVIGAGDTGADCIATALRQGAASVINLANGPSPPTDRDADHPWPAPKGTFKIDYAHKEAAAKQGDDPRQWMISTQSFIEHADESGQVAAIRVADEQGTSKQIPADLVLLAIGFTGHNMQHLLGDLPKDLPVIVTGDMARGPSLVVHAIAEGKRTADQIHQQLAVMG